MPYIEQHDRVTVDEFVDPLVKFIAEVSSLSVGEMNYIITRIVQAQIKRRGEHYADYESMLGRLEAVKLEWHRRVMAPYEDGKCRQNGDVF